MAGTKVVAMVVAAMLAVAALNRGLGTWAPRAVATVRADTGAPPSGDARAVIFVRRGCPECHAVSALGVKAAADVGPDLSFAYADVVNRYGVSLASFFDSPPGVMRLVLVSHLSLTQADRDSMLHVLKAVYHERLADMDEAIPSFPPVRARPPARSSIRRVPSRD
jgi:hypothetical protein